MIIDIGRFDCDTDNYYVRITERLAELDKLHRLDRIITSPACYDFNAAKRWLIKWLNLG